MAEVHAAEPAEPAEPEAATIDVEGGQTAAEAHYDGPTIPTEVWLLVALVVLIAAAWRPAKRAILGGLDARAEKIKADLDEVKRLREEAQATLATFQRKQRDAMSEAQEIIAHAERDAERLRTKAMEEIEESIKRREALAADRIAQAEAAALAEVRNTAVDVAIAASRQLIASELDRDKARMLIDSAIEELPQKLH
ncbi:MAG: F0F1 ATP synthase subunit B [Alphaproteobacteria bacterium]|jgi:F-type H+-transporting ATPase subunit b|nr:F0F1 ATP synthase subunit B [Alphaproteobacteria bacterium]